MKETKIKILFGSKAEFTNWGRKGFSYGWYITGGFEYYVYGIRWICNITILKKWGTMVTND